DLIECHVLIARADEAFGDPVDVPAIVDEYVQLVSRFGADFRLVTLGVTRFGSVRQMVQTTGHGERELKRLSAAVTGVVAKLDDEVVPEVAEPIGRLLASGVLRSEER